MALTAPLLGSFGAVVCRTARKIPFDRRNSRLQGAESPQLPGRVPSVVDLVAGDVRRGA